MNLWTLPEKVLKKLLAVPITSRQKVKGGRKLAEEIKRIRGKQRFQRKH